MRIDPFKIREVKESVDIVALVGRYVNLRPAGSLFKGLCPFHSEKTPSFFVYPDRGSYICYGCGEHGDAIDFLMKMEGLSFSEAVRRLAEEAGIELEMLRPEEEQRLRKEEMHRRKLYEANEAALGFFRAAFASTEGEKARRYVASRGISEKSAADFELGYAPDSWDALVQVLSRKGVLAYGAEVGLVRRRRDGGYYSFFRDRLVFPIRDHNGHVAGFGARLLDPEAKEAKYINSPESQVFQKNATLYGLHRARLAMRTRRRAIVVEGNVDVIQMHQHGFTETVAPLGTAFTPNHARLLARYAQTVFMIFDGDEAGRKATVKSVPVAVEAGLRTRVLLLPEGHDPDSFLMEHGADALAALLDRAVDGIEAYMELVLPSHTASIQDRYGGIQALVPVLSPLPTEVRDTYLAQAAMLLDLPVDGVRRAYRNASQQAEGANRSQRNESSRPRPAYSQDEITELKMVLYLMALHAEHPSVYTPSMVDVLDHLYTETARDLWRSFVGVGSYGDLEENDGEGWKNFLGSLYPKFMEYRATVHSTLPDEGMARRALEDALRNMELRHLRHRVRELERKITLARREGNEEEVDRLLTEKLSIEKRRIKLQTHSRKG